MGYCVVGFFVVVVVVCCFFFFFCTNVFLSVGFFFLLVFNEGSFKSLEENE